MSSNQNDGENYPPPVPRKRFQDSQPVLQARHGTSSRSSDIDGAITHTFLLWVLRQWWAIVIPLGLVLAAVTGALVIFFHVQIYEATALLMIEDVTPFVAYTSQDGGARSERYVQTQLELLRSEVVLRPVLGCAEVAAMNDLSHEKDRVMYLRTKLSIRQVGTSELYNISYRGSSPEDATKLVNAVAAEYMNIYSDDEFKRSQRVIDILEEERRRRGFEVERLRKNVVDLAKEVTGRDPFGGNEVTDVNRVIGPVGALFQSLTESDVEREVRRRAEIAARVPGAGKGQL